MKLFMLSCLLLSLVACGKASKKKSKPVSNAPGITAESIISKLTYPSADSLSYKGEIIADLSQGTAVVSSYGEVLRGRTLNKVVIDDTEFLIYGEDGVFATECEPNVDYPDHGSSHPKCQVAHGESFNQIIICSSTTTSTPVLTAQNWPGYPTAMTDSSLGMECWVNGTKMISKKIFTY